MINVYRDLIFTNHALVRLKERGISQGDAWAVWRNPDSSNFAKSKNAFVYYKTFGKTKIEVVAKQNEKKQWIVLSVWSKNKDNFEKSGFGQSLIERLLAKIFKSKV